MNQPPSNANAFNDVVEVTLESEEKAVIGYEPEERRSQFFVRTLAISRYQNTDYTVDMDGTTRFNGGVPPTDIDDGQQTFFPPRSFEQKMDVEIANRSSSDRTYYVQVIGWESRLTVDEDEGRGW